MCLKLRLKNIGLIVLLPVFRFCRQVCHSTIHYLMRTITILLAAVLSIPIMAQDIPPMPVVPTPEQIAYQEQELIGFIHYTVNAFTDKEWGDGKENPAIFNPSQLSTDQWAKVARQAGMKQLIITAKHHDGFCLWPSRFTDHSVKSSPWRNGQGDVVGNLAASCRKNGLRLGVYLSPWDQHEPSYGSDSYNSFYMSQLEELLTQYGEISEVWMDGARGENAKDMVYDFPAWRSLIYRLQPKALIFSDAGPDIRWIGNERGYAGETCWSTINSDDIVIGKADMAYLNTGDPHGRRWLTGECDVSIRPGWFYHPREDSLVKSPQQLIEIYYNSVGRNGVLLLNLPPDRRGLIHENDIRSLKAFRKIINNTFRKNLALRQSVSADHYRQQNPRFVPQHLTDGDNQTYWAAADDKRQATLTISLNKPRVFNRIMLQEPIRFGQRVSAFHIDAEVDGQWITITRGTTIGYKRLLRFDTIKSGKVRIVIDDALGPPALSNAGLFYATRE